MRSFEEIMTDFDPISLGEMDSVTLMDRTDTKYILLISDFPALLEKLSTDYFILEINGIRISQYKTLYFDTQDFSLYKLHLHGKLNRDKIRFRSYVCTDQHYFEIKNKNNKNRTHKNRIKWKETAFSIQGNAESFLENNTTLNSADLQPKIWVKYSRITLVNKNLKERLTLDLDLSYEFEEQHKELHDIVIAELKQGRHDHSLFNTIMHAEHIRKASFSKYCMGIGFLYPHLKFNRFKPHLLKLNKIRHGAI